MGGGLKKINCVSCERIFTATFAKKLALDDAKNASGFGCIWGKQVDYKNDIVIAHGESGGLMDEALFSEMI